ncbi:integrase catalytic domain-containing protein [Trichonephila clavipes]|nr:integrase catalytic domain-containing protein [Trichonephila clavipes]
MDALKLRRTPLRTAFTKAVNHLQEIIENDSVDKNAVETAFEMLDAKSVKLKKIDEDILELMIETNCSQEAYNIEFEAIEGYTEKMIAWQVRVKNIMKTDALGQKDNHSLITSSSSSLRLPKIQFQQFSGELTGWLRFHNQFKRIHEDESIDDGDKFQYLIQATTPKSRVRDIVESFSATPENYRKAFEYLRMRFGQEDILIQVYVRELLKLVLQNTEVKVNLSSLYDKIEAQLRALESLGVTKEKYAAMLFPLVESCLPAEILRAWERYVGYSSDESDSCGYVAKRGNHKSLVRALIDTGSQKSYILKSTAENLGFKYEGEEEFVHSLFGGSKTKMYRHKCYNICLTDIDNYYTCNLNVYDQEIICNNVPSIRHGPWINELKNRKINLSDSGHKLGGKIEILLGADVAGKLLTGTMFYLKSGPVAIKTKLGWTLMGKTYRNETKFDKNHFMNVTSMFVNDMCISDLWKLDSLGITDPVETKTKLEIQKEILNHFQKTISVDISGRYEVALPWVLDNKLLSSNRKLAENRLESTKRKLIATGKFEEYQDVLDLWLSGKIIEEVNDDKENFVHYLPHRPVIKENSTSKIRPVFDVSARTKGSPSLNDCLEKGPNFIVVIPTILNRFRKYKIGVISDIEKAFLQIGVREQDRDFLRFMWYDRENREHIKIYRHRRVVFGVTSSPFLLGATLNHHLDNAHGNFDNVAKILRKSFYVDNCVTSFETEEQLQKFIVESKILLSSAHFNLRGWQSNVLLNPEKFSELESQPDNFETMVLGLIWNLKDDCLSCNINCQKNEGKSITKRSLLSIANHIFDPIGFTAPVTLKPKLILQEIWKLKLKWDENLPKDILNQVKKWLEQLPILAGIKIPRCLNLSSNGIKRLTLHVFCDASKNAYATCVFLRVEYEENVFVKQIQAKARVAPLKDISIPRLELLACVLGTRLAASVKNDLNLPDVRIYYLTDSMTALAWIQRTRDWGVFVSNRVKEIRNLSDVSRWEHLPSEKNFADILSRGCSAQQLVYLRWWEGPSWLSESPVQCPRSKQVPDEEAVNLELRKSVLVTTAKKIEEFNWQSQYFSSYLKVVRMIAWMFRFFKNAKRIDVCNTSEITFSEFDHAEKTVIKLTQMEKFEGVTNERNCVL